MCIKLISTQARTESVLKDKRLFSPGTQVPQYTSVYVFHMINGLPTPLPPPQCEQCEFLGMARLFNYRMLSISYKSIGSSRFSPAPLVLAPRPTAAKLNEVKNVNFIWAPNVSQRLLQQRRLKTKRNSQPQRLVRQPPKYAQLG